MCVSHARTHMHTHTPCVCVCSCACVCACVYHTHTHTRVRVCERVCMCKLVCFLVVLDGSSIYASWEKYGILLSTTVVDLTSSNYSACLGSRLVLPCTLVVSPEAKELASKILNQSFPVCGFYLVICHVASERCLYRSSLPHGRMTFAELWMIDELPFMKDDSSSVH